MTSLCLKQDNDHKMSPYNINNLDMLINIAIRSIY